MHNALKIIIPIMSFTKAGGMRVLANIANELKKMGFEVKFIAYYRTDEPYFPIYCPIEYVDSAGLKTERQKASKLCSRFVMVKHFYQSISGLKKALNRHSKEFNVVIANYSLSAYAVNRCKIKNKYYYIQAYETWDKENPSIFNRIMSYIKERTYNMPLIRIVNADIYKNYKALSSEYVVPPGVDLSIFYPKSDVWNKKRRLVVGCIGRPEIWKGSNDVAKAVNILHQKGVDVIFRVAFHRVDCDDYEFVRPDGDANLADYYRSLDIMCAPGTIQLGAIHYPVLESMACHVPVITTGYYPATEENSYIVPIHSPSNIASNIEKIMKNYDEAWKKAEKATKLLQMFSWQKVTSKLIQIIQSTMR